MKQTIVPCAVLVALLGSILWNAHAIDTRIERWCALVTEAQERAEAGDWNGAREKLDAAQQAWRTAQTYFHIVMVHDELDELESRFAAAEGYAEREDDTEFRVSCAQLLTQLMILTEMQDISLRNIL